MDSITKIFPIQIMHILPPHVIYDYLLISPEIAVLQMNEQNRRAGRGASECAFQRKRV